MVDELEALILKHRPGLSRHDDLAKAMDYMLKRWPVFTRFLHDGRVCLTNNAAERALRGIALGRKAWLFVGSDDKAAAVRVIHGQLLGPGRACTDQWDETRSAGSPPEWWQRDGVKHGCALSLPTDACKRAARRRKRSD